MLKHTLQHLCKTIRVTQLNFLVAGHTYMPVDSIHSLMERNSRGKGIQTKSEWITIIKNSRETPFPYEIKTFDHTDFLNMEELVSLYFPKKLKKDGLGRVIENWKIKCDYFQKGL